MAGDLREAIFASLSRQRFTARIRVREAGLVCGLAQAREKLAGLGLTVLRSLDDGDMAAADEEILVFHGSPQAVAMAEDCLPGCIAKPTGIARAARRACELAAGRVRVVSGAAKKMPEEIKPHIRRALEAGGVACRIADGPFLYLDKNYVRMFGGVRKTLQGVSHLHGRTVVVQLRGEIEPLEAEAAAAIEAGADILMVDTGRVEDLELTAALLRASGRRRAVTLALAGDIALADIPDLAGRDVDILGLGRALVDAPLADLKMDVLDQLVVDSPKSPCAHAPATGLDCHLLEKTELRIDGITLEGANLGDLAKVVAEVLELPADKVLVIDVRLSQVSLDILMKHLRAEQFFGRKDRLLAALARVPGVRLAPEADIFSTGILGSLGLDEAQAKTVIAASQAMGSAIAGAWRARVRVFPTGFELIDRAIEDTNTPYLLKAFGEAGFLAEAGPALPDDREALVAALARAAETNGLIVTTGGVGAEDKDFSVEAIEALDPLAAAPYLVRFAKGHGRHVKDGVRIAVGRYRGCLLAALPGPHDEVRLAAPVLVRGYRAGLSRWGLAQALAACLRGKWEALGQAGHIHDSHGSHDDHGRVRS